MRTGKENISAYNKENWKLNPESEPYTKNAAEIKRDHPLMMLVKSEREELLGHPLVLSLLRHKWNWRSCASIYSLDVALKFSLLIASTFYLVNAKAPYSDQGIGGNRMKNGDFCIRALGNATNVEELGDDFAFSESTRSVTHAKYSIWVLALLNLVFTMTTLVLVILRNGVSSCIEVSLHKNTKLQNYSLSRAK